MGHTHQRCCTLKDDAALNKNTPAVCNADDRQLGNALLLKHLQAVSTQDHTDRNIPYVCGTRWHPGPLASTRYDAVCGLYSGAVPPLVSHTQQNVPLCGAAHSGTIATPDRGDPPAGCIVRNNRGTMCTSCGHTGSTVNVILQRTRATL